MYRAARLMQVTVVMLNSNAAISLRANLDAYNLFPWPARTRAQLSLTFHRLMDWKRDLLKVSPVIAATIHRIALTAGAAAPATLAARLDYLTNYGHAKTASGEIESILKVMRRNATRFPGTWLHEGWQAVRVGDKPRAVVAIGRARAVMGDVVALGQNKHIADQIDVLEKRVYE